ncbi:MAG: signal transduction histidine kinase [Firmicutes bacterium]|nr:signal transduction histidine kinase [Bacillota bacterium]
MEKTRFSSTFAAYLKSNLKAVLLLASFVSTFAVVFSLYNLPVEAVVYAALLCAAIGIVYAIVGSLKYHRRHNQLTKLQNLITLSIDDLPVPRDLLEKDYQKLIETVHRDKVQLVENADSDRSNMVDYYTLWAHQIKTPIAAMRLLLQSAESEQNKELSMELFKIEQYVEMVLQYLRIDSESSDFVVQRYSLDEIVRQAVRKYAKIFIYKKISLDLADLDCEVITDEKWLIFVVEQILSNSLKYTNKGTISIYMEGNKTLVIEDTGIGIKAEDLPRVFEKGFTGYNGRDDKKSTGIGLYLCKRILTKLSHTIMIESEVGKGTKVKIGLDSVNLTVL